MGVLYWYCTEPKVNLKENIYTAKHRHKQLPFFNVQIHLKSLPSQTGHSHHK